MTRSTTTYPGKLDLNQTYIASNRTALPIVFRRSASVRFLCSSFMKVAVLRLAESCRLLAARGVELGFCIRHRTGFLAGGRLALPPRMAAGPPPGGVGPTAKRMLNPPAELRSPAGPMRTGAAAPGVGPIATRTLKPPAELRSPAGPTRTAAVEAGVLNGPLGTLKNGPLGAAGVLNPGACDASGRERSDLYQSMYLGGCLTALILPLAVVFGVLERWNRIKWRAMRLPASFC